MYVYSFTVIVLFYGIHILQPDKDRESALKDRENVRVVVRVRPQSEKEIQAGYKSSVEVDDLNCSILVTNPDAQEGEPPKVFTFDSVFGTDSKQVSVLYIVSNNFCW